jgi:hypothetical protein
MVVVGRVSFSDGSIEPWGADAPGEIAFGFAGRLNVDGTGDPSALTFLENGNSGFVSADGGRLAGRALNDAEALDVRLFDPRGAPIELGDPSDASSDEVVTSASVNGNAMLVTGWMTEDAKLAQDLCGPGCQGDLRESDPICAAASPTKDAFWVVIEDGSRQAVGRGFGDCGNQVVKNGVLSETFMTLAFETEGVATIDTLDGASTELSFDAARKGATIARLPRPKPAQPN